MLSKTLDILTPLSKLHRITRQIADTETFEAEVGVWVQLNENGRVFNIDTTVTDKGTLDGAGADPVDPVIGDYYEIITTDGDVGGVDVVIGDFVTYSGTTWIVSAAAPVAVNPSVAVEMCINRAIAATNPMSAYEANDTKVGSISTISKPGTRIWINKEAVASYATAAVGQSAIIADGVTDTIVTPVAGNVTVGIVTEKDAKGIEVRLTEPEVVA